MELGIYMNKTSFLSMLPPRRVARFTYSAECTLKSKVKFKVGLHIRNSFEQVST